MCGTKEMAWLETMPGGVEKVYLQVDQERTQKDYATRVHRNEKAKIMKCISSYPLTRQS